MNVSIASQAGSTVRPAQAGVRRVPGQALFWAFQSYVVIAVACSSFFPILFRYQEHAVIILSVLCLGMCWLERVNPWIKTPLDLPLWLFITWVLCTVPFATDPSYSFAEWKKFVAQAVVFYWVQLVLHRCRREHLPQQILWSLTLGASILALYALVEFVDRGGTWKDRNIRAHAFGSDYNWLNTYMVMTLPILLTMLLIFRERRVRIVGGLALGLGVLAQVASYTRAGWLGHVVQLGTYGFISGHRRVVVVMAGIVAVASLAFVVIPKTGHQVDTVDPWTLEARAAVWKLGLKDIREHPLVGVGYGNDTFIKRHREYSPAAQAEKKERERVLPAMHSTFLMIALGSGVPAFIFFLWTFVTIIRVLIPFPWSPQMSDGVVLVTGVGIAVVGFVTRNLFDYMFAGSLAHLFWILVAVGVTVRSADRQRLAAG
ncbi:MAG: hypothetical protein OJF52_002442 [Nitrospira sp.]|jgi:heptosyltransferase-3/putative inorganic carbon (HCO3(-)) transporter|nr:MAG: hypothetical protein OJF52_002442 [Nitrospira sp.]